MNTDIVLGIFDRIKSWKDIKDGVTTQYRLLYLECMRNLDLMDCFKIDKSNKNDPDLKSLIKALELDYIELTFFDNNNTQILHKLINCKIEYKSEENKINGFKSNLLTSVYLKIRTIKKLAEIEKKGEALRNINYKVRLANIKEGLLKIVKILGEEKETFINKS